MFFMAVYYIFETNVFNQASYLLLHGKEGEIALLKLGMVGEWRWGAWKFHTYCRETDS
jgi:hypothetical protein